MSSISDIPKVKLDALINEVLQSAVAMEKAYQEQNRTEFCKALKVLNINTQVLPALIENLFD